MLSMLSKLSNEAVDAVDAVKAVEAAIAISGADKEENTRGQEWQRRGPDSQPRARTKSRNQERDQSIIPVATKRTRSTNKSGNARNQTHLCL